MSVSDETEEMDVEEEELEPNTEEMEEETEEETKEPSYAYILEKDQQLRMCRKDLGYCVRDQEGKPVPFCFEYPNEKGCLVNTYPPQYLFMGCYDDATCGGKRLGKVVIDDKIPPYALTADGKCTRSSKLCMWATNSIAVPQCAKDQKNIAKCRDIADDFLLGCYTEETCGGNVVHTDDSMAGRSSNLSASNKSQAYAVKKPKPPAKKKRTILTIVLVFILISVVMTAAVFYYHYWNKTPFWKSTTLYFRKWNPRTVKTTRQP